MVNVTNIAERRPNRAAHLKVTAPIGVVGGVILNLMLFLLVGTVVGTAAWHENETARQRAQERVAFELADLQDAYGRLVTDYAWWDEAEEHIVVRGEAAWVDENISNWLGRTANLTAAYAFDDQDRLVYSSAPDRATPGPLAPLLAAARGMQIDRPVATTGFATIGGRTMLLAAAVLRPMELSPAGRYGNVLVFAWDMQTVVLDRLRATTRMDGLRPEVRRGEGLDLRDLYGQPVLRLGWHADQPGTRFAAWVLPSAGLALSLLSALGWRYWRRGRQHLRALVAAEESRLRLLAAISHDLRQPLQSMALFTASLEREVTSAQGLRAVGMLRQGTERMGDLLAAILRLARLDMQRFDTVPTAPVALNEVLGGLVDELEPQATAKGLVLRRVRTSLVAPSDAVMLAALVRNLISNAIRYTNHGKVLVGVRRRRNGAEIWVCDTGIGIADHQQRLIFEEFFQVGNPSRDPTQGIGLGLSIVQRLARLLDCRVHVRSRPGRGSSFVVELPYRA